MASFVVLASAPTDALEAALTRAFPEAHLTIARGQYLVAGPNLTSREVVEKIGGAKGEHGQVVAFSVNGWWGWHRSELWEWLKAKSAA